MDQENYCFSFFIISVNNNDGYSVPIIRYLCDNYIDTVAQNENWMKTPIVI